MRRADNAYSRLVALLKLVLPLAALAVLSTLFLVSRRTGTVTPSEAPVAGARALAAEPRISAPDFTGMTADGTAVMLTAASAVPDPADPTRLTASRPAATLVAPDGGRTRLDADRAHIDGAGGLLTLTGDVRIATPAGYDIRAGEIVSALDVVRAVATGGISATGPLGRIEAGGMVLRADSAAPGSYVVVFNSGVKMRYDPQG